VNTFFAKRPALLLWAIVLAMLLARAKGPHGFHQW
jgi:hypothetical protein